MLIKERFISEGVLEIVDKNERVIDCEEKENKFWER